jgi:hypothetical protein
MVQPGSVVNEEGGDKYGNGGIYGGGKDGGGGDGEDETNALEHIFLLNVD